MSLLTFTLLLGLALGHFVFICYHTDFIFEYGSKLGLSKLLKLKEYKDWCARNELDYGYPIFLRETFKGFWFRLIGCPFCLATFLSMTFSLFSSTWAFPMIGLAAGGIASFWYLLINLLFKKNSS